MTPLLRKILGMNWLLVLTMLALVIFGVYAIESAARHLPNGGGYYAQRQKMWIIGGCVIFFITALIDYRWIRWLGIPMYLGGLALMMLAMFKGSEVHQISVGSLSFQPTQLGIAGGIVLMGSLLQDLPRWHAVFRLPFVRIAIIGVLAGVPFLIVVAMGDMGSAMVWLPVTAVIMYASGIPYRYLLMMMIIGFGCIALAYFVVLPKASERGAGRIELYLAMLDGREVDINGDAYAPYWVSTAIGKAGYKGIGWNASSERGSLHDKKYIPWKTAHNDFIFAVIGEEQGFRGSLLLLTGYAMLLIQCLFIAFYSRDSSGRIIAAAVVALLFAHIFENIGMCVLMTPITGIPLPLVSYSGTFVVMVMFLLGLVQSVWIHRNAEMGQTEEGPKRPKRRFTLRKGPLKNDY
ncbi:MAG: FtsW/RodA/SpoVE family cell cycle protein [Akkermansiaceae bacterium]|jgi:rod shape determining protein RodA|tara:strand:+ start:14714 stop:15931 length:1218 start_codon:yes stop_codon:yes gene_type:complete